MTIYYKKKNITKSTVQDIMDDVRMKEKNKKFDNIRREIYFTEVRVR